MFNDGARLGRRLRALCLCLVTLCTWVLTLPVAAQTSTTVNNLTVLAPGEEGTNWEWNGNDFNILLPGEYTVSTSGTSSGRINVRATAAGTRLVLNGLKLDRGEGWGWDALAIEDGASAELVLAEGTSNYLRQVVALPAGSWQTLSDGTTAAAQPFGPVRRDTITLAPVSVTILRAAAGEK